MGTGATLVLANLDGRGARPIRMTGRRAPGGFASRGTGAVLAPGTWQPGLSLHVADFTGDGRDDVFGYDADNGTWIVAATREV